MKWTALLCSCCLLFCVGGCGRPAAPLQTAASVPETTAPVRIACVGDSITAGYGGHCYVDTLAQKDGLETGNFGVCGTTATTGSAAYERTDAYKESLDWEADIVVLMFGTNDSVNWQGADLFREDYAALVDRYLEITDEVLLCTPLAPGAMAEETFGVQPEVYNTLCRIIKAVAEERALPVMDCYQLSQTLEDYTIDDGVHPNQEMADQMAEAVYQALQDEKWIKTAE